MEIPLNWTFERHDVATAFDRHVREQLPWYDLVTGAVAHVARHYIPERGTVYDIGASTGNIGLALAETLDERRARIISIERSEEMAAMFAGPQAGNLVVADATDFSFSEFDVSILFLVLQFMTISERYALMERLRRLVRPGGAIVIVDKCEATAGYAATVLWRLALAGKVAAEVPPADIVAKELSLIGVQRPLGPQEIGADWIEFFRFGDFAGWLIEA